MTYAVAVASWDHLTHCARLEIEPEPLQRQATSLTHSATAGTPFFFFLSEAIFYLKKEEGEDGYAGVVERERER